MRKALTVGRRLLLDSGERTAHRCNHQLHDTPLQQPQYPAGTTWMGDGLYTLVAAGWRGEKPGGLAPLKARAPSYPSAEVSVERRVKDGMWMVPC